ncbi:hypothetical protein DSO57_1000292 [Entomophthora muscae]|uniref:Uncharacterized protein n=1 Tax=Entomophthora muscae TaxID=34485 RepID=A0ACC2SYE8_9FUNG|nr:hypothetical protein DSO57_1000292 [Entomophthora muscae]
MDLEASLSSSDVQTLNSLCRGRTTVLKVFRRLGCPFTRYDAQCLSREKAQLEAVGATLIGITFEDSPDLVGLWEGEMYHDAKREVYTFLRLRRLSVFQAIRCLASKETSNKSLTLLKLKGSLNKALKEKYGSNSKGDSSQLGGTFVIDTEGRVLYSHLQSTKADMPDLTDVYRTCQNEYLHRMLSYVSASLANNLEISKKKRIIDVPFEKSFFIYRLQAYARTPKLK